MRTFPLIDFGNGMIDRGQRLFLLYGGNPLLDRSLIGGLHLIEF
jgi:hypothetical protein